MLPKGENPRIELADEAKSLGDLNVRELRFKLLGDPHVKPLTDFVTQIRNAKKIGSEIPFFDPFDGGIEARVLFVLEAPGPKSIQSGFISCNNPDETAKNMFHFIHNSGFSRGEIALWNIVPWYIGNGTKIRKPKRSEIKEGLSWLVKLVELFKKLDAIIFVGNNAASIMSTEEISAKIKRFHIPHPSPLFVNRRAENKLRIVELLTNARHELLLRR